MQNRLNIFVGILFICNSIFAQDVKQIKVRDLQSEFNEFMKADRFVGISDPNLKPDDALAQATERAYLVYSLCSGIEVASSGDFLNEEIVVDDKDQRTLYSYKHTNKVTFKGTLTDGVSISKRLYLKETGECIVFVEKTDQTTHIQYNGVANVTLNWLKDVLAEKEISSIILDYKFNSGRYNEEYRDNPNNEIVTGDYTIAGKKPGKIIGVKKVQDYEGVLDQKRDVQYSSTVSKLDYGLWNAFVNCFIHDITRIAKENYVIKRSTVEKTVDQKDVYAEQFSLKGTDAAHYTIPNIALNGIFFSEFGLNLDLRFFNPSAPKVQENQLELNRYKEAFEKEMQLLEKNK